MGTFPISPQQSRAGIPEVHYLPEVASATWKVGALLLRDANGFMAECGAAPATLYGVAVNAGQNLASSGLAKCAVYRPRPGERFECTLVTAALTQTMAGENYGFVKNGSGYWELVPADAGDQAVVSGWSSLVKIGAVDPIIDITFDEANLQEI